MGLTTCVEAGAQAGAGVIKGSLGGARGTADFIKTGANLATGTSDLYKTMHGALGATNVVVVTEQATSGSAPNIVSANPYHYVSQCSNLVHAMLPPAFASASVGMPVTVAASRTCFLCKHARVLRASRDSVINTVIQ